LDSGFFYVVNHGISQEFMDEVFTQSKKFFSLPLEEKMKILRNEKHRGYTPVLDELLDPENQVRGMYAVPISDFSACLHGFHHPLFLSFFLLILNRKMVAFGVTLLS